MGERKFEKERRKKRNFSILESLQTALVGLSGLRKSSCLRISRQKEKICMNPVWKSCLYSDIVLYFHFGNLSYWPSEPRGSFVSNKWVMKHKIQHLLIFGVSLTLQRTHVRALKLCCYTNAFWQSHHSISLLLTSECSHYLGNFTGEMVSTKQTCGSWMGPT